MTVLAPKEVLTFLNLMDAEEVPAEEGSKRYVSKYPAWAINYAPDAPLSELRVFGGHVYAQSIWVAALTLGLESGYKIHESNGYWTRGGFANRPFVYTVKIVSSTRSFIVLQVIAQQPEAVSTECPFPASDAEKPLAPVCFVSTCSFKLAEPTGKEYWRPFDGKKYGDLLKNDPSSFPVEITIPGSKEKAILRPQGFGSIDIRTPDLEDLVQENLGANHGRIHVYHAVEPSLYTAQTALHAAAHAYTSDTGSLIVAASAHGNEWTHMAGSLSHKIIFHVEPEELLLDGPDSWFVQEMTSSRAGNGRATIESRIWGPDGKLIASTMQDAQFRFVEKAKLS